MSVFNGLVHECGTFLFCMFLRNGCAEGECSKLSQLECLLAKGDTDDGNAEDQADKQISDRHSKAAEEEPDHVCDGVRAEVAVDGLAEGGENKACHLERLSAEGDTDDGNAPKQTGEEEGERATKAAKEEPDQIADEFHSVFPFTKNLRSPSFTMLTLFYQFVNRI